VGLSEMYVLAVKISLLICDMKLKFGRVPLPQSGFEPCV
jgi:hypothetical protein